MVGEGQGWVSTFFNNKELEKRNEFLCFALNFSYLCTQNQ